MILCTCKSLKASFTVLAPLERAGVDSLIMSFAGYCKYSFKQLILKHCYMYEILKLNVEFLVVSVTDPV